MVRAEIAERKNVLWWDDGEEWKKNVWFAGVEC